MINIQNIDDNQCLVWGLVRYLNPSEHHLAKIAKADKDFGKTLDYKDIIFQVKIRDICKIENKNSISISVFGYENKKISRLCVKKNLNWKTCWLIIDWSRRKRHVFWSKILIDSGIIIYCNSEKNAFVVIAYMLSSRKNSWSVMWKIAFKLMVNKRLRYLRKRIWWHKNETIIHDLYIF